MSKSKSDGVKSGYYQHRRESISKFIDKNNCRILDVGCAAGNFGAFLKGSGCASEVVGIEVNQGAADQASRVLDKVHVANLDEVSVDELFGETDNTLFDFIICADVLEHLIDPWRVLSELIPKLGPQGKIIASIPNVRHWSVWAPLLFQDQWRYMESGIMDRTHLRFFTKKTMLNLFEGAGLEISEIQPLIGGKWKLIDKLSLRLLRGVVSVQWVLVGTRATDTS